MRRDDGCGGRTRRRSPAVAGLAPAVIHGRMSPGMPAPRLRLDDVQATEARSYRRRRQRPGGPAGDGAANTAQQVEDLRDTPEFEAGPPGGLSFVVGMYALRPVRSAAARGIRVRAGHPEQIPSG